MIIARTFILPAHHRPAAHELLELLAVVYQQGSGEGQRMSDIEPQNSWERGTTSIHARVTSRLYAFGLPARPEGSTPKSLSRVLYVSDRWRAAPRIDRQMSGESEQALGKRKAWQRPMPLRNWADCSSGSMGMASPSGASGIGASCRCLCGWLAPAADPEL